MTGQEMSTRYVQRLAAATALVEEQLALARACWPGDAANLVKRSAPRPAVYRVFEHLTLGVQAVVRDRAELPGYRCGFGPAHEDGTPVTFAEAVAFANRAFLRRLQAGRANARTALPPAVAEG